MYYQASLLETLFSHTSLSVCRFPKIVRYYWITQPWQIPKQRPFSRPRRKMVVFSRRCTRENEENHFVFFFFCWKRQIRGKLCRKGSHLIQDTLYCPLSSLYCSHWVPIIPTMYSNTATPLLLQRTWTITYHHVHIHIQKKCPCPLLFFHRIIQGIRRTHSYPTTPLLIWYNGGSEEYSA